MVYSAKDEDGLKRARFDAQTWWYRGNGDAAILSDEQFLAGDFAGRNVILYGNATTNRAFAACLGDECPVRVEEGRITVGGTTHEGAGLGCTLVYPRKGDAASLVGVLGHTGTAGARVGFTLLHFVSGVGYPDYAVFGAEILEKGDEGVLAAGWFDHAWKLN